MKKLLLAAAAAALLVSPVLASQCPADMATIDKAMETPQLSDADREKVKMLRQEGEALHASGSHQESEERLAEAKAILGVE